MKRIITKGYLAEERAKEKAAGVLRLRVEDLHFIPVQAPEEQVILFEEGTLDPKSSWRAGVNSYPSATQMETYVPSLLQRELDNNQLHIEEKSEGIV